MNLTKIALRGAFISTIIALIQGALTFWRTNVIITTYGTDINSISQIAYQIFSYLVLFESGLGAAYLYKMYEPISNKQYKKVNALYLGLTISLKGISLKMFIGVVLLALIYPLVLSGNSVGYFGAFIIIILLGIRFVFPYYFTLSKKNMLAVTERQYLVVLIDGIINILIIIFEIILAKVFGLRIEYVLLVGILFSIFSNHVYVAIIKRKCQNITANDVKPLFDGNQMTKDIMVHQIASLANTKVDTIILSIVDLFSVTVYSAYDAVMTYPITLVNKVLDTIRASIGLKLASSVENTYSVFKEIMSVNFLVASITTATFISVVNDFIYLWIGEQFILNFYCVILFGAILMRRLIINPIYLVRDGQGLYKESKYYTVLTTIVNVLLSLILVKPLGIFGLLIATVFSSYLIMDLGNYYLVYCVVFKKKLVIYWDLLMVSLSIFLSLVCIDAVINKFNNNDTLTWESFIINTFTSLIISTLLTIIIFSIYNRSFVRVIKRIMSLIKRKIA
ncbi:polysaccharide biosynthesis protein [Peribacillus frigoritolerans]|uniref:hypothetical protein n=1 Tax=Peribacillus frigoritolerans TaxID=450367 RepID=UPI002B05A877|nr:hypothetical protein [Peribacillus frigoritolerans]MEA3573926.1 hypothetical protein [Peribacillus frigoritolerans]